MKTLLIIAIAFLLLSISLLHLYWVAGGKWGLEAAIPEKFRTHYFNADNHFSINIATLIVAVGLLLFATIIASNYFDWSFLLNKKYSIIGTRIIGAIFMLRAIGDFNIVGLFKKPSNDIFAKSDNKIFIPICLFLGIGSLLISFWN